MCSLSHLHQTICLPFFLTSTFQLEWASLSYPCLGRVKSMPDLFVPDFTQYFFKYCELSARTVLEGGKMSLFLKSRVLSRGQEGIRGRS